MIAAPLANAIGVLLWFGLAFGTRTWLRQWLAAGAVGLTMAWWGYPAVEATAEIDGIPPISFPYYAGFFIAGMLSFASVGMLIYKQFQKR